MFPVWVYLVVACATPVLTFPQRPLEYPCARNEMLSNLRRIYILLAGTSSGDRPSALQNVITALRVSRFWMSVSGASASATSASARLGLF